MSKKIFLFFLFFQLFYVSYAQDTDVHHVHSSEQKLPPVRIAALIGHTLIPEEHAGENFFIPSWGLDIEYWFSNKLGVGIHSDLEMETFVILRSNEEQTELERLSPLVSTLDVLYKPWKGLVLQLGPGLEFERSENFPLFRMGIEYEFEIHNHWDISPTAFYDTRFGEYHTWSIALGIGKQFGF